MRTTRRDLLKTLGAAALGVAALPILGRGARAALPAAARARRLIVLNLSGGVRSSAAFLASHHRALNPWGTIRDTGSPFAVGRLLDDNVGAERPLDDAAYALSGEWDSARLPRLREVLRTFSVLGTWHPERGDHGRAYQLEATGAPNGAEPGLLVRLYAGLAESLRAAELPVPPFEIAPSAAFGQAPQAFANAAPISVASASALASATMSEEAPERAATADDWAKDDAMEDRLDRALSLRRAGYAKLLVDTYSAHRRTMRRLGEGLAAPWVKVAGGDGTAAQGTVRVGRRQVPLTNAMLNEVFALGLTPQDAGAERAAVASNFALAIRLLQMGSPAVVVNVPDFDFHSGERRDAPASYRFLGRTWAALGWLLRAMPEPGGGGASMFDKTLVVTMSDFGRDPGLPSTGFNGGEGSDHGAHPACYYLAHAVMGAGVRGGRLVGGVSTETYDARRSPVRFGPRQLLATVLKAFGLDERNPQWGFEDVGVTPDLWTA